MRSGLNKRELLKKRKKVTFFSLESFFTKIQLVRIYGQRSSSIAQIQSHLNLKNNRDYILDFKQIFAFAWLETESAKGDRVDNSGD